MTTENPQPNRVYPLVSARVSVRTDAQLKRLCRPRERSRMVALLLETILNAREWESRGELIRAVQRQADALAGARGGSPVMRSRETCAAKREATEARE